MDNYEHNEDLEKQAFSYQQEIDRLSRDYQSEIEDLTAQRDALEKQNADLRVLLADANTRNAAMMAQQANAAHALADYQDVAFVQADVMQSFKADLDGQAKLAVNYGNALRIIANSLAVNSQQYAQAILDKYATK